MITYSFFIKTNGHIDKLTKPIKRYNGKVIKLTQSFVEADFEQIKELYELKIKFENNSLCKKFVKYIKNNISNKYDFFLYS
jgi:hypothetical protein